MVQLQRDASTQAPVLGSWRAAGGTAAPGDRHLRRGHSC